MEIRKRRLSRDSEEKSLPSQLERLDIFTKLPPEYQEKSLSGATVSIVSFVLIVVMLIAEIIGYAHSPARFTYEIDRDHDSNLRINVDMTVAMPCSNIGADVVDTTGASMNSQSELKEDDINFELTEVGKHLYRNMQKLNNYLRSDYSSLRKQIYTNYQINRLWKSSELSMHKPLTDADRVLGCRIHGSVFVKKVAGNFHITAGKHIELGFGSAHAHLTGFLSPSDYNFSHRIHHFSFGDPNSNMANPLDSEESITNSNFHMFQYFIQVVSTRIRTLSLNSDTYQYAVTDQNRSIDHGRGSHGMPGIFVRYDISPMLVNVVDDRTSVPMFLVRLAAIVGGIFATSGFLHLVLSGLFFWIARLLNFRQTPMLPLDATIKL